MGVEWPLLTIEDLAGDKPIDGNHLENAFILLDAVNDLMSIAMTDGVVFHRNKKTTTYVSGDGNGGYREQSCPVGAKNSAHKTGQAVDLYDPDGEIDKWCMDNLDQLESCGIYLEHPDSTPGWAHWSTRKPGSGNRVFMP